MNEAETRAEHIDPALKAAGWGVADGSRLNREYHIAPGDATLPTGALPGNPLPGDATLLSGGESPAMQGSPGAKTKTAIQENGAPTWHSRGYLPHFESAQAIQHVTFHLADSLAQSALRRFEEELKFLPAEKCDAERRKRIDHWIDAGHGSCVLGEPPIADMVQSTLLFFDAQRYRLLAWVVMPNHVHTLFQPIDGWTVALIVASWKKFTARRIRDRWERRSPDRHRGRERRRQSPDCRQPSGRPNPVWAREYWDRYIRNEQHFQRTVSYIHSNPVKAGLVSDASHWRWSSAFTGNGHGNATIPSGTLPGNPLPGNATLPSGGSSGNVSLLTGKFRRKP